MVDIVKTSSGARATPSGAIATAVERFPKTVSACHVEIIRLRNALAEIDVSDQVAALEAERDELRDQLEGEQKENGELSDRVKELEDNENPDAVSAIDLFLYEVERPVGCFNFDVVHGAAADRAILGLYDAVGRQP